MACNIKATTSIHRWACYVLRDSIPTRLWLTTETSIWLLPKNESFVFNGYTFVSFMCSCMRLLMKALIFFFWGNDHYSTVVFYGFCIIYLQAFSSPSQVRRGDSLGKLNGESPHLTRSATLGPWAIGVTERSILAYDNYSYLWLWLLNW